MPKPKCIATTNAGNPCPNVALENDEHCFAHTTNEEIVRKRSEGKKTGGRKARYKYIDLETVRDDDLDDWVIKSLEQVIIMLSSMDNTATTARATTTALATLDKALERRENRIKRNTKVTVVYVNDWRS